MAQKTKKTAGWRNRLMAKGRGAAKIPGGIQKPPLIFAVRDLRLAQPVQQVNKVLRISGRASDSNPGELRAATASCQVVLAFQEKEKFGGPYKIECRLR
jgi:hypothetical protein